MNFPEEGFLWGSFVEVFAPFAEFAADLISSRSCVVSGARSGADFFF